MFGFKSHQRQLIFLRKSDCLGCVVLLFCCLHDLACFFPLINMYIYMQCTCIYMFLMYTLMRDEKGRKKETSKLYKQQTKQHSTPKAITFPKKNELPLVGFEPTTLHTLDAQHVHIFK